MSSVESVSAMRVAIEWPGKAVASSADFGRSELSASAELATERDESDRQFEARKAYERRNIGRRVASLLLYLSSQNAREGGIPR